MNATNDQARFNMIEQQIRPWGVLDGRVLAVMSEIRRELFVPDGYQGLAYADIEIPIGRSGMLAPKVVGRMLQALDVRASDRVLEIGSGTGYVTACLARLGSRVVGVEIDSELAAIARERLQSLGLERVEILIRDAMAGPIDAGPFDVIAVTGSLTDDEPLPMLQSQLTVGGRLFVIIGEEPLMRASLITRTASGDFRHEALFETSAPALENLPEPERFVF